jgi:hypothetical protein
VRPFSPPDDAILPLSDVTACPLAGAPVALSTERTPLQSTRFDPKRSYNQTITPKPYEFINRRPGSAQPARGKRSNVWGQGENRGRPAGAAAISARIAGTGFPIRASRAAGSGSIAPPVMSERRDRMHDIGRLGVGRADRIKTAAATRRGRTRTTASLPGARCCR